MLSYFQLKGYTNTPHMVYGISVYGICTYVRMDTSARLTQCVCIRTAEIIPRDAENKMEYFVFKCIEAPIKRNIFNLMKKMLNIIEICV